MSSLRWWCQWAWAGAAGCGLALAAMARAGSMPTLTEPWLVAEVVTAPAALEPLRAPLPFANVRDVQVTSAGDVFFIADEAVAELGLRPAVAHGIYLSHALSREVVNLIGPETALPPLGRRPRFVRALRVDAGRFVFHAVDEAGGHGLYLWKEGALRPVARTLTPAPDGGFWRSIGYGSLEGDAVVFTGVEYPQRAGLFRFDITTGNTVRLLDAAGRGALAQQAPLLELFWQLPSLRDGTLTLGGRLAGGGEAVLVHPPIAPGCESGTVGHGAVALQSLWSAGAALPVPDGVAPDYVEQPSTGGGFVAFNAGQGGEPARGDYGGAFDRRTPDYEGVFLATPHGFLGIIDTETFIPGHEATFTGFRYGTACHRGRVVFVGEGPAGFRGAYLYDPARDVIFTLATTRAPLENLAVEDLEVGAHPLQIDCVALTVRFAPGQERATGVFLASPAWDREPVPLRRRTRE
jgi:hypothetical protein